MTIPKLRFKDDNGQEFPAWKEKKVSDIFDYIVDKKHQTETVLTIKQGIGTVPRQLSGIDIKYNAKSLDTYKLVEKNDFIVHLRSFQAGFEIANTRGIVSPAYTILRNKTPIAYGFYRAYFRTNGFINHNLNIVVEGIRDGRTINTNDLKERPLPFPSLMEQQKIADFLSSYDAMIDNQSKRVEVLKLRKRGLLQKIFSQEIRFKDKNSQEFPQWEEKRLGDVCNGFASGQTPTSTNASFYDGDIPWLNSGELNRGIVKDTRKKITEKGRKNANLKLLPKGTFLIAITGLEADQVCGNCAILGIESTVNQSCMYLFPKSGLYTNFLFQWYLHFGKSLAKRYCQGTKQQSYNAEIVKSLPIIIPSLQEQRKIADFLGAIDKQIEVEEKRLETMKNIKKGLLQQLFV